MGSVATLTGTVSGSSAWVNVASYDPPARGTIDGVSICIQDDSDADADVVQINVTFSSTPGIPVNSESSSIVHAGKQFQLVTSGAVINGMCYYIPLPNVPIAQGQRLYLHSVVTTGVTAVVSAQVHLSFNIPR